MQPQQNFDKGPGAAGDSSSIVCTQCGAPMPQGMRFCRTCGNRLGEGPAEYTETVRLPNSGAGIGTDASFGLGYSAPMTKQTGDFPYKRKKRISGMAWVLIAIAIFFVLGGVLSALKKSGRIPTRPAASVSSRSYFGVDEFENTTGGVTFDNVEPPGSPADKAGLVGGDIVTTYDGHVINDEDQIMDLLRETPIGKTVEVLYLRDGEQKKTQLTTMSEQEYNGLARTFDNRPEGRGMFGFESDRTTRISLPENKVYGVRLDYVQPNGPADLFGLKPGDIIIEFDGVPIRTSGELLSRVRRAMPRSVIPVKILRDAEPLTIEVTMGRGR